MLILFLIYFELSDYVLCLLWTYYYNCFNSTIDTVHDGVYRYTRIFFDKGSLDYKISKGPFHYERNSWLLTPIDWSIFLFVLRAFKTSLSILSSGHSTLLLFSFVQCFTPTSLFVPDPVQIKNKILVVLRWLPNSSSNYNSLNENLL